jgi:uncharacterized coiled-coil protein SlyX
MTIIKPNTKPRLWWLFPWAYARTLHTSANALRALSDRLDDALTLQSHVISDQSEEIANLRQEVERQSQHIKYLTIEANTDHERWLRVVRENEALRKKGAQS